MSQCRQAPPPGASSLLQNKDYLEHMTPMDMAVPQLLWLPVAPTTFTVLLPPPLYSCPPHSLYIQLCVAFLVLPHCRPQRLVEAVGVPPLGLTLSCEGHQLRPPRRCRASLQRLTLQAGQGVGSDGCTLVGVWQLDGL